MHVQVQVEVFFVTYKVIQLAVNCIDGFDFATQSILKLHDNFNYENKSEKV